MLNIVCPGCGGTEFIVIELKTQEKHYKLGSDGKMTDEILYETDMSIEPPELFVECINQECRIDFPYDNEIGIIGFKEAQKKEA